MGSALYQSAISDFVSDSLGSRVENELLRTDNSFAELMEQYADMVLRICCVFMRNRPDTEDFFQEVFLKLCKSRPPFRDKEQAKAWLITVARNTCRSELRSFWRRRIVCVDEIIKPVRNDRNRDVISAVLQLPLKYRDVLYLHYYQNYKVQELADMLHTNESTVKTRLARGREQFKKRS